MSSPAPTRLAQLLTFYEADATDPFVIYALATEYRAEAPETAWRYYQKLLADHPDYVGTYYHAGKLLEQFGRVAEAEEVYRKGLVISRRAGQLHAASELQGALNSCLGMDYEDD